MGRLYNLHSFPNGNILQNCNTVSQPGYRQRVRMESVSIAPGPLMLPFYSHTPMPSSPYSLAATILFPFPVIPLFQSQDTIESQWVKCNHMVCNMLGLVLFTHLILWNSLRLFCASIVCFSLLMSSSPWFGCTIFCLII